MGVSGKWVKAILGGKTSPKVPKNAPEEEKSEPNLKRSTSKATFWKQSKSGRRPPTAFTSENATGTSAESGHALAVATATAAAVEAAAAATNAAAAVARLTNTAAAVASPPTHLTFKHVREERAALEIQTAIRAYQARRRLSALKSLVKLQALVRGHLVRKQAEATLRSMQALVRVQTQMHQQRMQLSNNASISSQRKLEKMLLKSYYKECEEGWIDQPGPEGLLQEKAYQKQIAAVKRERALSYAFAKQWKPPNAWRSGGKQPTDEEENEPSKTSSQSLAWLDWWMSTRPWENRVLTEQYHSNPPPPPPPPPPQANKAGKPARPINSRLRAVKSKVAAYINEDKPIYHASGGARGGGGRGGSRGPSPKLSSSRASAHSDVTCSSTGSGTYPSHSKGGAYLPLEGASRHHKCNEMKDVPVIKVPRPQAPLRKVPLLDLHSRKRLSINGLEKYSRQNSSGASGLMSRRYARR